MSTFIEVQPTLESYWRSIILFGRNVASYKFALGKSLLQLAQQQREVVTLEELAEPFALALCQHLKIEDKQITSSTSQFLEKCRAFNRGEIEKQALLEATARNGFNNVIDAFHVVHDGEVGVRFFEDERTKETKGIRLTDQVFKLGELAPIGDLSSEIEGRWRLVETAWALKLPRHVLTVAYDANDEVLIVNDPSLRRRVITGCRNALNGYQKGKCFYCFGDVSIISNDSLLSDVDHFFPHTLKPHVQDKNLDGVWNLVLACQNCNRGPNGKFARVPSLRYLERLHTRNSFFIDSHHPLRETLMLQTGKTEPERRAYLQRVYNESKQLLIGGWEAEFEYEARF